MNAVANNVSTKILDDLNNNTLKAIETITDIVEDKPIDYYPIDKETSKVIGKLKD